MTCSKCHEAVTKVRICFKQLFSALYFSVIFYMFNLCENSIYCIPFMMVFSSFACVPMILLQVGCDASIFCNGNSVSVVAGLLLLSGFLPCQGDMKSSFFEVRHHGINQCNDHAHPFDL